MHTYGHTHTSSTILSDSPKAPKCKQRSSCECLLCIVFSFLAPPYTRDDILWGRRVSEMDCGVCIFTERRRRRLFLTFQLDALPSWDCITIPLPPCCFPFLILLHQRVNADFGLRITWTETHHPRI